MNCFSEHGEALAGPTESGNYLTSWLNTKFWSNVLDRLRRAKYADSARFEVLTALLLNIQTGPSSLLGRLDTEDDGTTILRNVRNSCRRISRTAFTLALFVCEDVRPFDVMASNRRIPLTNTLGWSAVVSCEFLVGTSDRSTLRPVTDEFLLQIHWDEVQLCLVSSW